jgi:heat shock protein HtpX
MRNLTQGALMLVAMVILAGWLTSLLFGAHALPWVLMVAAITAFLGPRTPTRWLMGMFEAQPLSRGNAPRLHAVVDELAHRAGLDPTPALYYVPTEVPNAFAVGRGRDAALAVTDGLLRMLDERELVGVLAHEVSHIRNGDTLIMGIAGMIARLVQTLAYVGLWSVFLTVPMTMSVGPEPLLVSGVLMALPSLMAVLQLSLSRSREHDADLDGAALTGDPGGLASGLLALEHAQGRFSWGLFGPHRGQRGPQPPELLRSHPDTAERVRRLRELARAAPHRPAAN